MILKYVLPVLALAGIAFAVLFSARAAQPLPVQPPIAWPAAPPFDSFVAGAGLVEASSENVAIGTPVGGVVIEVAVKVGDRVRRGDLLFRVDDRAERAELAVQEAALAGAIARQGRLLSLPRAEDLPPAEARVAAAEGALGDAQNQLDLAEALTDPRALSQQDLARRRFGRQIAEALLARERAELALLREGAWEPDRAVAEAEVAAAEAQVEAVRVEIERLSVRSPLDGQVLQLKVRAGEFAPAGATGTPLALLGAVEPLHVRVDIDENDAWRVRAGAPARAFLRGRSEGGVDLAFVRFEPYVVPKRSLTGDSTERVDTRVLQVLYAFDPAALPVFVGQQLDVYIEAPPVTADAR